MCNAVKYFVKTKHLRLSYILKTCTIPFLIVKEKTTIFKKKCPQFQIITSASIAH